MRVSLLRIALLGITLLGSADRCIVCIRVVRLGHAETLVVIQGRIVRLLLLLNKLHEGILCLYRRSSHGDRTVSADICLRVHNAFVYFLLGIVLRTAKQLFFDTHDDHLRN